MNMEQILKDMPAWAWLPILLACFMIIFFLSKWGLTHFFNDIKTIFKQILAELKLMKADIKSLQIDNKASDEALNHFFPSNGKSYKSIKDAEKRRLIEEMRYEEEILEKAVALKNED